MKILHLCGDAPEEGAARGAQNLHQALLGHGVESKLLFARGQTDDSMLQNYTFYNSVALNSIAGGLFHRIEPLKILALKRKKIIPFSLGQVGYPLLLSHKLLKQADIIHLHWINSGFVSVRQLMEMDKPIVWTMRDEWPYTGGCHYAGECDRYERSCGKCPLLFSHLEEDLSRYVIRRKTELRSKGIRYIAISNWIKERASRSFLLNDSPIDVISNSIDPIFLSDQKMSAQECRDYFGLPRGKKLILAGAQSLDSRFKGYSVLGKFKEVPDTKYVLVTFGSISDEMKFRISVPSIHLGKIQDSKTLFKLYSACDIFIGPSVMEAFGKTLAEASASGLPVVAYDYGGPRDVVNNELTGFLVPPFDEEAFVRSTMALLKDEENLRLMGYRAREHARSHFDSSKLALKYIDVYGECLSDISKT